jgi:hypothetical protein
MAAAKNSDIFRPQVSLSQMLLCLTGGAFTYVLARHSPAAFAILMLTAVLFLALVVLTLLVVGLLVVIELLLQLPEYLAGGALWISETQPRAQRSTENPYRSPFADDVDAA